MVSREGATTLTWVLAPADPVTPAARASAAPRHTAAHFVVPIFPPLKATDHCARIPPKYVACLPAARADRPSGRQVQTPPLRDQEPPWAGNCGSGTMGGHAGGVDASPVRSARPLAFVAGAGPGD